MKYAPHIEKFFRTSAAYVFWSSVRFVLDSLYINGKTVNVTHTEMNTGRLSTVFYLCSYAIVFLTLEDGTDNLSRNIGKKLLLLAAQYPRRAQFSSTLRRKPEIMPSDTALLQKIYLCVFNKEFQPSYLLTCISDECQQCTS